MYWKGGGVNPALHIVIGLGLGLSAASAALAGQAYSCTFTKECIAGEPCEARDDLPVGMAHEGTEWVMTMPDASSAGFRELAGAPAGSLRLISTDIDRDASAVALLSVSGTGQAIMSIQGYFPSLGALTLLGQCTRVGQ